MNRVSIQMGTRVIDKAMRLITKQELDRATDTWIQTNVSLVLVKANEVSRNEFLLEKMNGKVLINQYSFFPLKL